MNHLYYGDCFTIMQEWPNACIDLIYLDPPFNSNRTYNAIYKDETGRPLPDQIEAFCDMWELDEERERAIRTMPVLMRESGLDDSVAELWRLWMQALRGTQPRLLAYLSYMAERLLIMHRILKPTGSLYFHCGPTVSHYVKPLLDAVFGHGNFRNEIIWKRSGGKSDSLRWGVTTDRLLFYTKSHYYVWNQQYQSHNPEYLTKTYRSDDQNGRGYYTTMPVHAAGLRTGESGATWNGYDPSAKGRHWATPTKGVMRQYIVKNDLIPGWPGEYSNVHGRLDALQKANLLTIPCNKNSLPRLKTYLSATQGVAATDLIIDVPMASGHERMGYATQKPLALLERILQASSNPGDVVLDPFCGCATTLEAAHKLDRQWVGIDIAIHAVKRVARIRLNERLGLVEGQDYTIDGIPSTLEGAKDLWRRDKYHFQKWAVEQVEGFVTTRRTADGGIDGRVYFAVPNEKELQSMVVEVKGGANVDIRDVRALKGVLDYDTALMAGLIIMEPLGPVKERNFVRFMADAGAIELWGNEYPRMQLLTVGEILDGKRFRTPTVAGRHELSPRMPGLPV